MLFEYTKPIVEAAERYALGGANLIEVLPQLRKLSMEDFGLLLISMPNGQYPALSKLLPRMASEETQIGATGKAGVELLKQTAAFARQLESIVLRQTGLLLQNCKILDFGVGYGRNIRSMLYFTDPENLWGVDAWQSSLDLSIEAGIPAQLSRSHTMPAELPVGDTKFDLAFAFSVFTHLSKEATLACLAAIRKCISLDGVCVITVRPIELWNLDNKHYDLKQRMRMIEDHRNSGFAFVPLPFSVDGSYGDSSMDFAALNVPGWQFVGYDSSLLDPYQLSAILRPA
ncbi:class I SAM-dependent methyltransferase [Mesorhizobium sp. M1338]|uniref:class I SAM-dependent methyltransferase n=1 Tax=Mesorhizobium sp. M1338 TaxID=2957085 RepID=UPI003339FA8F